MRAKAEAKWGVLKAVDGLLDAIANGRFQDSLDAFTGDEDAMLIGSEPGEIAIGPEALRAFFAELYAKPYRVMFTLPERRVSAMGNVAWLTGEGTYRASTGGEELPYRLTAVLERRQGVWLWQLFSGSEPMVR
jgi:ketosteroid isomerase-like protein